LKNYRFLDARSSTPDNIALNNSALDPLLMLSSKQEDSRKFLNSQYAEYDDQKIKKCDEQRQIARSVLRCRKGRGSLCELAQPIPLQRFEPTPYSAINSINDHPLSNLKKNAEHKRHKTAIMLDRKKTPLSTTEKVKEVQKAYNKPGPSLIHKIELTRPNTLKNPIQNSNRSSFSIYKAYASPMPLLQQNTNQDLKKSLKFIMEKRAKSVMKSEYSQLSQTTEKNIKEIMQKRSPSKKLDVTDVIVNTDDYSTTNWKQTNSTDLTAGPQSFTYAKCASIQIYPTSENNAFSNNKFNNSSKIGINKGHSESLDINFASKTNLESPIKVITGFNEQLNVESIEEIHYFYVNFHQKAKKMLKKLEIKNKKEDKNTTKTIKSIKNEEESEI